MEKQLQTNTEITKLKEIINSFKHIGTIEKNSQEIDYIWYSENFPKWTQTLCIEDSNTSLFTLQISSP